MGNTHHSWGATPHTLCAWSSCFDNAVQSEEAGKNKAACMHLLDFQQCLCATRINKAVRGRNSWLPWQLDRKLGAGKVFDMVITMSMGKTRFWGWWVFDMVITMSIGQKTGNREGFLHGDYHVNGQNTVLRFFTWWLPCQLDPCQPKSPIGWPLKKNQEIHDLDQNSEIMIIMVSRIRKQKYHVGMMVRCQW